MAKKTNLAAALAASKEEPQAVPAPAEVATVAPPPVAITRAPSRAKQINISAWFDPPVKFTLEELRLMRQKQLGRRVTLNEVIGEAFNDIFKKYGLPEVAPTRGKD